MKSKKNPFQWIDFQKEYQTKKSSFQFLPQKWAKLPDAVHIFKIVVRNADFTEFAA